MNSKVDKSVEMASTTERFKIPNFQFTLGLGLSCLVAWLGINGSEWIGKALLGFEKSPISGIMMAIVFGLLIANLLRVPDSFKAGIRFSVKSLLKLGIILLGIRLSLGDVLQVGAIGLPIIIFCMTGGVIFARWLSQRLGLSPKLGTLIAIGTSICGATAIVAIGPALDADEEEITYAVANITIFGIVAMFLYPYLAHWLFGDNSLASGLMLGTSIHETSQVAGSGLMYAQVFGNEHVLDIAAVTKLVRNVFMVALIPIMAYLYRQGNAEAKQEKIRLSELFPTFILGFLLLVLLRTVGDISLGQSGSAFGLIEADVWKETIIKTVQSAAEILLAIAMAGVGLSTNLGQLRKLGMKPFYVGFASAVLVAVLSIISLVSLNSLGILG